MSYLPLKPQAKTRALIEAVYAMLEEHRPMTLRQIFYQLVSHHGLENNQNRYHSVGRHLAGARRRGEIPWAWIEDRTRWPRAVAMWTDPHDFMASVVPQYRRDVWATQPRYLEAWLEKDALSGIFADALEPYGVTLNVGKGYDGWSSLHDAADRLEAHGGGEVLYFGDFDPRGEDMARSLEERLLELGAELQIAKLALTMDQITKYDLPPDATKLGDTCRDAHIAKHGNVCVELDALPPAVLGNMLTAAVKDRMDMVALTATRAQERADVERLRGLSL